MAKKRFPLESIISPLAGFLICILIILFCGKHPGEALASLFTGTFASPYYFGAMLNTAAFLMTAGCGESLALKSGNMNLGGEGQVYIGGFVSGLILTSGWNANPAIVFTTALLASMASGALMALISALLKEIRGAQVLLTSFLVSAASLPIIDGLITHINGKAEQNLIALAPIPEQFRFTQILPPSPLNPSFFAAIVLCILAWLFLKKTRSGRHIQVWGTAPEFARYCGYSPAANNAGALMFSGAMHALTGLFAVCGTHYTCHKGFYTGMGWNALSASLIVSSNPLALVPASLVLSWLYTSADRVGLTQGFGFDISGIVSGCILFAIAIPFAVRKTK